MSVWQVIQLRSSEIAAVLVNPLQCFHLNQSPPGDAASWLAYGLFVLRGDTDTVLASATKIFVPLLSRVVLRFSMSFVTLAIA